jgi:hypothetical protein
MSSRKKKQSELSALLDKEGIPYDVVKSSIGPVIEVLCGTPTVRVCSVMVERTMPNGHHMFVVSPRFPETEFYPSRTFERALGTLSFVKETISKTEYLLDERVSRDAVLATLENRGAFDKARKALSFCPGWTFRYVREYCEEDRLEMAFTDSESSKSCAFASVPFPGSNGTRSPVKFFSTGSVSVMDVSTVLAILANLAEDVRTASGFPE